MEQLRSEWPLLRAGAWYGAGLEEFFTATTTLDAFDMITE